MLKNVLIVSGLLIAGFLFACKGHCEKKKDCGCPGKPKKSVENVSAVSP